MEELKRELLGEIDEFYKLGKAFINKEVSKMEFKHHSGGMGVYAHRDQESFMIRLRTPSGIIAPAQLKQMTDWARKYNLEGLHFTTRQAVQFHGLNIDEICELMEEGINNNIYTRGAGGDFPRNVALSPLSGVDKKEAFDATPYAVAIGNYFMERITSYKLPRKLKVSVSSSTDDTAQCTVQDLGFMATSENGSDKFKVYLGGGLGRNPRMALEYPELINPSEILYYVEAMVKLFMAEGNYEQRAKARVRYMVEKLGEEEFLAEYKKYVNEAKEKGGLDVDLQEPVHNKLGVKVECTNSRLIEQKQDGLYTVYLHPTGGQIALTDLDKINETISKYDDVEIRLAMSEGVYFRNLNGNEAIELLEVTKGMGGENDFEQSISCIGVPTCQMGICHSQETLREILSFVKENNEKVDLLPKLHISGCGNSCGVHQIGEIGLTGGMKRIDDEMQETYEVVAGGSFGVNNTKLAKSYGVVPKSKMSQLIDEICKKLNAENVKFVEFYNESEKNFAAIVDKYKV